MVKKMKKYISIILTYLAFSISGFIGLSFYMYNYFGKLIENSDNLIFTIIGISLLSLLVTELYLFTVSLIAIIGYFVSKYKNLDDYIKAFKYLIWIHLSLIIGFTLLCFVSFGNK